MKKQGSDLALQGIWRNKDELSAARGHDVPRLFADAGKRQTLSGHPVVSLQKRKAARHDMKAKPIACDWVGRVTPCAPPLENSPDGAQRTDAPYLFEIEAINP